MWCLIFTLVWVPPGRAEDVDGLEAALSDIHARFPKEVASDMLYRAALEGVAKHLGTVMGVEGNRVLTESEQQEHASWLEGERIGIGAEFSILPGRGLLITEVFEGGPASDAGLEPGDLVVSMNEHPFTGQGAQRIHAHVRRCSGPSAVLDVRRNDGAIRRVDIQRGAYRVPPVRMSEEALATPVARVPFFGKGTAVALENFLREQRNAAAVIIDLRDNEGGSLDEVVESADLFLDPGSIVVNRGKEREHMEPLSASKPAVWVRNVVILVNQGTEGVAEAFAAALRDNGRCVLVGTRSAGRAVDTSLYPAGRGFVMQVADIHLASPSGRSWSQRGLKPNVLVESTGLSVPVGIAGPIPDLQRDTAIRLISTAGSR
jgi:carboxyl-terminal processing protease